MQRSKTVYVIPKRTVTIIGVGALILMAVVLIGGCGGDEEEEIPDRGDSGSGAPESIIGFQFVGTVTENHDNDAVVDVLPVGEKQTLSFIDRHTIRGENTGGFDLPTESWSYERTGSHRGRIVLSWTNGARDVIDLTFTSESGGRYTSTTSGRDMWVKGNFRITRLPSGGRSVLVWPMEDACRDGHDMELRFFDRTNDLVWPGEGRVYVLQGENTYRLACRSGAKVCYGARARNSPDSSYWGVGIDDDEGCTGCCYTCPTGDELEVDGHRLTCS